MRRKNNRSYPKDKKLKALREHLQKKVPVSDVCEKYGVSPGLFYSWQKNLFDKGSIEASKRRDSESSELKRMKKKVALLEAKLLQKDSVMAELMLEHITLKKSINGES